MSMKVYDAYRLKKGVDPWALAGLIRSVAQHAIKERLKAIYERWMEADRRPAIVHSPEYLAAWAAIQKDKDESGCFDWCDINRFCQDFRHEFDEDKDESSAIRIVLCRFDRDVPLSVYDCSTYVYRKYRESEGQERSTYNLDTSAAIVRFEDRFYLRTYGDDACLFGDPFGFVRTLPEVESYEYQNHSERPKGIRKKDWEERYRVWDTIFKNPDGPWWRERMDIDVCSYTGFYHVNPWLDMIRKKGTP